MEVCDLRSAGEVPNNSDQAITRKTDHVLFAPLITAYPGILVAAVQQDFYRGCVPDVN